MIERWRWGIALLTVYGIPYFAFDFGEMSWFRYYIGCYGFAFTTYCLVRWAGYDVKQVEPTREPKGSYWAHKF